MEHETETERLRDAALICLEKLGAISDLLFDAATALVEAMPNQEGGE